MHSEARKREQAKASVTDLGEARDRLRAEDPEYDGVTCHGCGSAWFDAIVVIEKDGHVSGYNWPPKCHDCGLEVVSTRG